MPSSSTDLYKRGWLLQSAFYLIFIYLSCNVSNLQKKYSVKIVIVLNHIMRYLDDKVCRIKCHPTYSAQNRGLRTVLQMCREKKILFITNLKRLSDDKRIFKDWMFFKAVWFILLIDQVMLDYSATLPSIQFLQFFFLVVPGSYCPLNKNRAKNHFCKHFALFPRVFDSSMAYLAWFG